MMEDYIIADAIVKGLNPIYIDENGAYYDIKEQERHVMLADAAELYSLSDPSRTLRKAYVGSPAGRAKQILLGPDLFAFLEARIRTIAGQIKTENTGDVVQPVAPGNCYYWTAPSGTTKITLTLQGAGGAGSGGHYGTSSAHTACGGGGGGYFNGVVSVNPGQQYLVCVGAGGYSTAGKASTGTAGGQSSFGNIIAYGGGDSYAARGNIRAGVGTCGNYAASGTWICGGNGDATAGQDANNGRGGSSAMGTGGRGYNWDCNGCVGENGIGYGSGGGAGGDTVAGGAGAPGYVRIIYG